MRPRLSENKKRNQRKYPNTEFYQYYWPDTTGLPFLRDKANIRLYLSSSNHFKKFNGTGTVH